MTATASPVVRDGIAHHLRLRHPVVIVRGFDRPNIRFEVQTVADDDSKGQHLARGRGRLGPRAWSTAPPAVEPRTWRLRSAGQGRRRRATTAGCGRRNDRNDRSAS